MMEKQLPTPATELTVAEYFAGIGLFRMGLESEGWRTIYANDWSSERRQIYEGFFQESYEVRDIFSVSHTDIPDTTLATCSFPCIDLSLAGKRRGMKGNHSKAFWGFHDLLRHQGDDAPPVVLLENVVGWLYSNEGEDFFIAAKALNDLGYELDVFQLNARSFVPQSRPRIFMVGFRGFDGKGSRPFLNARSKQLLPARLRSMIEKFRGDLNWAHLDIPEPPPYMSDGLTNRIVEQIPNDDSRWWQPEKVDKHMAMMAAAHLERVLGLSQRDGQSYRTFFRRRRAEGQRAEVRSDDIAGCLRTAVGGSGKQFLVAAGDGSVRMRTMTSREYARLQGVPDEFPIVSRSERQSLNAFGDAVCVPAVSWIAREVLNPLLSRLEVSETGC